MTTRHSYTSQIMDDVTLNVPSDFATVNAALMWLDNKIISADAVVTIKIASGTLSSSYQTWEHPQASRIIITGEDTISTTITSNGTISGSAGAWNVIMNVASTTGFSANDYVLVLNTTTGSGTHYHAELQGMWKVVSVDSSTQLTLLNTAYSTLSTDAKNVTGGDIIALKSVLSFTGTNGVNVKSPFKEISYLAILGDSTVDTCGIGFGFDMIDTDMSSVEENLFFGSPYFYRIGVSGFGNSSSTDSDKYIKNSGFLFMGGDVTMKDIATSDNGIGLFTGYTTQLKGRNVVGNGNYWGGLACRYAAYSKYVFITACGQQVHGVWCQYAGMFDVMYTSYIIRNVSCGAICMYSSASSFRNTYTLKNVYGHYTCKTSVTKSLYGSTSSNTTYDNYALYCGRISTDSIGTPSPAAATLGNNNSYIWS